MAQFSPAGSRRLAWLIASLIVGAVMAILARERGLFMNADTRVFEIAVFLVSWFCIALLLWRFLREGRTADDFTVNAFLSRKRDRKD